MKRPALILLLLLAACKRDPAGAPEPAKPQVEAKAQPAAPATPAAADDPWTAKPEAPPDTLKRVMLWSITRDGKTSYAMGTMHVGIDPDRLPKVVWDKLASSPKFAMETDAANAKILNLGERKSGSLHEELGPVYWEKLGKLVDPKMLSAIDQKKAVIAAVFLSMRGLPRSGLGMDVTLLGRAQAANKPVVYLEPASKQVELLERHMDVKALKLMIDTADQTVEMTKQMVAAYTAGDDQKLLAINDAQQPEALKHGYTAAEYELQSREMLYDRNASWIPAIEKMHAEGGGFVAVGALHLVGKQSVLELLAAKGYKIQRLEP